MIALGLIVVKISFVVGDFPKRLKLFNTILIVKMTGKLMKCILHPPEYVDPIQVKELVHM